MIGYFPSPYPDELFYSLCARYSSLYNYSAQFATLKELFGTSSSTSISGFAGHLNTFHKHLFDLNSYSPNQIIRNHTIFPFFSGFLPSDRYFHVCEDMKNDTVKSAFYRMGILGSCLPMPSWMRFCIHCQEEDVKHYGETYWHRHHQLPGIEVCHRHQVFLQNSKISLRANRRQSEFIPAEPSSEVIPTTQVNRANRDHQTHLYLAREATWLLLNPIPGVSLDCLRNRYLHLLIEQGYATFTGSIKVKNLLDAFLSFYSQDLLQQLHCQFRGNDILKTNWVLKLVRKPRNAYHPLYHLLFLHFLGITVKEFFALPTEIHPFGDAPWPCLNRAAEHYGELVITDFRLGNRLRARRPIGSFYCDCGFCYSRTGPDLSPENRFQISKMISFGSVWENELKRLWKDEHLPVSQIAKLLNVDPLTVKRHAARMGLVFSGDRSKLAPLHQTFQVSHDKEQAKQEKCDSLRSSWLTALNNTPEITMKALRQKLPHIYQWLIMNDAAWLKEHQPVVRRKTYKTTSVNWAKRDLFLVEAIGDAATTIRQKEPRLKRITKTAIGRELGQITLLLQKTHKMPLSAQLLTSVIETREEFAIRRISWVTERFREEHFTPRSWHLVQRAGVYAMKDFPSVRDAIEKALISLQIHQ